MLKVGTAGMNPDGTSQRSRISYSSSSKILS